MIRAAGRNSAVINGSLRRHFSDAMALTNADTHLDMTFNERSSVSGVTCTLFGAYGFVGRYVVNRLGRVGTRCVVPYRGDGMRTRHLKLMGDLGQVMQLPMELTDPDSIRRSVEQSDVVINMLGSSTETSNYSFDDVNVKCVHRLAKICAEGGNIKRFIHVSAAGADENSKSKFLQSKARGEESVKSYFPQATIIRPTNVFGREDKFLNRYASMMAAHPIVPILGDGDQKLQPIYVQDVAQCIVNAMVNTDAPGKTYTLGGPEVITKAELIDFIAEDILRPETTVVGLPEQAVSLYAKATSFLPKGLQAITQDDVDQMHTDNIVPEDSLGCSDLGVNPVTLDKEGRSCLIFHRGVRDKKHGMMKHAQRYGKLNEF